MISSFKSFQSTQTLFASCCLMAAANISDPPLFYLKLYNVKCFQLFKQPYGVRTWHHDSTSASLLLRLWPWMTSQVSRCVYLMSPRIDRIPSGLCSEFDCWISKSSILKRLFGFQYPAALMNLGAILHLNGKLQDAEANYLRALQLKPDDTITQSNLRKLWNIMEKQGLRTTRPWTHLVQLLVTPRLGKGGEGVKTKQGAVGHCYRHPGRWKSQRGCLLGGTSLNLLSFPQAKSRVHGLAGATHYLDSLRLSSRLVLSQEPHLSPPFFYN